MYNDQSHYCNITLLYVFCWKLQLYPTQLPVSNYNAFLWKLCYILRLTLLPAQGSYINGTVLTYSWHSWKKLPKFPEKHFILCPNVLLTTGREGEGSVCCPPRWSAKLSGISAGKVTNTNYTLLNFTCIPRIDTPRANCGHYSNFSTRNDTKKFTEQERMLLRSEKWIQEHIWQ